MKLIFELGVEGRGMTLMPECDVPEYQLPEERSEALHLPRVSENELTRHYTALCKRIHGVNDGFYPLGSCTMKYNPKIDEDMAALPGSGGHSLHVTNNIVVISLGQFFFQTIRGGMCQIELFLRGLQLGFGL